MVFFDTILKILPFSKQQLYKIVINESIYHEMAFPCLFSQHFQYTPTLLLVHTQGKIGLVIQTKQNIHNKFKIYVNLFFELREGRGENSHNLSSMYLHLHIYILHEYF